jgi:subtilase family serine protease
MRQFGSVKSAIAQILSITVSTGLLSTYGWAEQATTSQHLAMTVSAAPEEAKPTFHLAPVILDEPDAADRTNSTASMDRAPHRAAIRPELASLSSRRLTPQIIEEMLKTGSVPESSRARGTVADPMASTSGITVYTPAQIRAAYGLPALPGGSASVTSAQAAQLGAGQTIYIIDANDDPNAAAELAAFNSQFGLPTCTVKPLGASASLPLAAAPSTGCVFSVAYVAANGALTATAPVYNSSWATEIAIDVQWAHATAPYARIVLVETPSATLGNFVAAAQLINSMGPGVVSMSFGAAEGGYTSTYDPNFVAPNMTYVAATGDAGEEVNWPAVSTHVLAVSGTSLTYSGTGARSETVWSGTGGGVSVYTPTPSYQTLMVPGFAVGKFRAVSDVTFNANPNTGQYLAVMPQGSTAVGWYSAGGTSLATPQWAGIIAIANALRAQTSLAPIGALQPTLYGLATQSRSYASSFLDVTTGSDGACATCYAETGYDLPSGLGSPNAASLLPALTGVPAATAPVVSSATVTGKAGVALSFTLSATDSHPLTYSLAGAPAGLSVNSSTGVVSWSSPTSGNYSVTATALDATTGLSGQATISIAIVAPQPPTLSGGAVSGIAQTALTFTAQATDVNAVTYSLSGAPSGMTVSTAGVVTWAAPLAGTYAVTVLARDATTGLSGQGLYTVTIAPQKAPTVAAASTSGTAGQPLSFAVNVTWSNPLTYSLSGAPTGMSIASGTGLVTWTSPVVGTYSITVAAKDTKTGLTGTGLYTVTINAAGPVIQAASLSGVAGKALTGSIGITDNSSTALSVSISGIPQGMNVSAAGGKLVLTWASPVTGTYSVQVVAVDTKNLTCRAIIPVVITAH